MNNEKILVVIPAYNECGNIRNTVEEVRDLSLPLDILVVDDGSVDNTVNEIKDLPVYKVSLPFNLGIGSAVQTGFIFACKNNYDVVVRIDGDGQHDVEFIKDILVPVLTGEVDIVIGSRFVKPFVGYRSSFIRRLGIHFFAYLLSFLTQCKITDPTSGFQAYNKNALKIFSEYYPSDFPEPESIIVAKRLGLSIKEVPVKMRKRLSGNSSIRYLKTLYYMLKVTLAILLDMIKRKDSFKSK